MLKLYVLNIETSESLDLNEILDTDSGVQVIAGLTGLGLPPVDAQFAQGAGDGAVFRGRRVLARDIDLPLHIESPDRTTLRSKAALVARVFSGECYLRLVEGTTEWRTKIVRVGGGDFNYGIDTDGEHVLDWTITVRAGDPYWTKYGATQSVQQTNTSIGPTISPTNNGTADAYPVWEITGPGTDFTITNADGETLTFTGKLANNEKITIDTAKGTVTDANGDSQYARLAQGPRFFALGPGANTISLSFPTYAPAVLRTNLATNPDLETSAAGWTVTQFSSGTRGGSAGAYYFDCVISTNTNATHYAEIVNFNGAGIPITAGQTYTFSAYVFRALADPAVDVSAEIVWLASDAGSIVSIAGSGSLPLPRYQGVWVQQDRYSVTATAPAGATVAKLRIAVKPKNGTSGTHLRVQSVLFEQANSVQPFFTGSTANTTDYSYAWTGTAHQSTSTQSAASVDRTKAKVKVSWDEREWLVI